MISTNVLDPAGGGNERPPFSLPQDPVDLERELQTTVALGANIPFWKPWQSRSGGLSIGIQTGVFARFRLDVSSNDLVASDWLVAMPVEAAWGRFSARFRLLHWSAHLGDEIIGEGGAERVDFTFESLELLGAVSFDHFRIYGGGSTTIRSSLENDPAPNGDLFTDNGMVQAGVDASWHPWDRGKLGLLGGIDWKSAERTDWQDQVSVLGGLTLLRGERELRVVGRYFDGPSPLGQFFLTPESYWGFDIQLYY